MCHNPDNTNDERVSRVEGTTVLAHSVHFKPMIHSIHSGENLTQPYVLGGNPAPTVANPAGNPVNFGEVRFPNHTQTCTACHTSASFDLDYIATLSPTRVETLTCTEDPAADADSYCQTRTSTSRLIPPVTSSCVSCHDSPSSEAHAEVMTTTLGVESCATCHNPGSFFGIDAVHQLEP